MNQQATTSLAALRRFAAPRAQVSRCELCSAPLDEPHAHLVDPANRRLMCACQACAMLFTNDAAARYRRVPRDARTVPDLHLDETHWRRLGIPVGLVFFFRNSVAEQTVAIYPSPAGPTETIVQAEDWEAMVRRNSAVAAMAADVEALLINRMDGRCEQYIVPIDQCYHLVGVIRSRWTGFTGGSEVRKAIASFFDSLAKNKV